jgi:aromatic ring-cleaving dioxygenase
MFQIRTIFDHLALLFCSQNRIILAKSTLFLWQIMDTQNGNLQIFIHPLATQNKNIFHKSLQLWLPELF